jgi:hypothetical protein
VPADLPSSIVVLYARDARRQAEAMQRELEQRNFVVALQSPDAFGANRPNLAELLNLAGYFDYCVALFDGGLGDILFEFGMFFGRLGPARAFPVFPVGIELPADWQGVPVTTYDPQADPEAAITEPLANIMQRVDVSEQTAGLAMLPSTALATGYFHNFLSQVMEALSQSRTVRIRPRAGDASSEWITRDLTDGSLTVEVRVPRQLGNLRRIILDAETAALQQIEVETTSRAFPFYLDAEVSETSAEIRLVDFPTTLLSASYVLDELFDPGFLAGQGDNVRQRLEDREIRNFENTLRELTPNAQEERFFDFTVLD